MQPGKSAGGHVPWLDGLRGGAALWVLLSHVLILTGCPKLPGLSWGGLAVDLFMILSGFLMAHHYLLRREDEPWNQRQTATNFWIRRFFRIAPLYYLLLGVAIALGPWLGAGREAIAQAWPATATEPLRYQDQSLLNVLAHVSFVFGAVPSHSFRTALPDWSIGLEMQFYLVFPILMLAVGRFGAIRVGLFSAVGCLGLRLLFADFFEAFHMPSFLPIKMYLFVIGIWMACGRRGSLLRYAMVSLGLCSIWTLLEGTKESMARLLLVGGMFYLMDEGSLPGASLAHGLVSKARDYLSRPASRALGDWSYGIYLVHLVVLLPVAGALAGHEQYRSLPWPLRLLSCLVIVLPITLIVSRMLHRTVELEGIKLGKATLRSLSLRSLRHRGASAEIESVAAGADISPPVDALRGQPRP